MLEFYGNMILRLVENWYYPHQDISFKLEKGIPI
jgi:hypothetical protein